MDDSSVIDIHNDVNNLFEMQWSKEHEKILVDWADKAMCYRWLHSQANQKFTIASRFFTIPVIIISTVTGTANFAQDRVPTEFLDLFVMVVGGLNLIAGIISTIQQFLKINELNESHRVSSIAWDKFYRNIKIELAKNPKERIPVGQMLKLCKEEFDRLMETSPIIQEEIINKFKTTFKNSDSFEKIQKPEICDSLVSTIDFLYISKDDNNYSQKSNKIQLAVQKMKDLEKTRKQIYNFIDKFKESQDRLPTRDELVESINMNDDFKLYRKEHIEIEINRYFEEQDKKDIEQQNKDNSSFSNENTKINFSLV